MLIYNHLSDLDELLLTVRNKNSQSYIQESIIAYRSGAYRASITSIWIAINYDIVSKLRELALHGDKSADEFIKKFDALIGDSNKEIEPQNIKKLQDLENSLLDKAKNEFEFINLQEYEDLTRIKRDRNLCAHPAYTIDELLFQPTSELVRTHIVHAILHLLQRAPVQGKIAIDRVLADIKGLYFPDEENDIFNFLNKRYLERAKQSFIRNLLIVLIKELFSNNFDKSLKTRIVFAIKAISKIHTSTYLNTIDTKLDELVNQINDSNFDNIFYLWKISPDLSNRLPEHIQIKIKKFLNPIIQNYCDSQSYRGAEENGRKMLLIAPYLTSEQIKTILNKANENQQIYNASGSPEIIADLFKLTYKHLSETKIEWISFIQSFLDGNEPTDHYAYPELQSLLKENGINWGT